MNILVDYHHGALYKSLHLLFEKRFGWNMYRPIGMDWFTEGFWKVAEPYGNAKDTICQYLGSEDRDWEAYVYLNGGAVKQDGVYKIADPENNMLHRAIELSTFKEMRFDFIVSTHPLHGCWERLREFQPGAVYIAQLGNEGQDATAKHILSSVYAYAPKDGQDVQYYHQEFDGKDFYVAPPSGEKKVTSFVIGLPFKELFQRFQSKLPEFDFKAYGPGAIDGTISGTKAIGDEMRRSMFGWHIKPADGYGHVIHNWFACGRPVITKGDYYLGKTAGRLLVDGETCIDLDRHGEREAIELIRYWSEPEHYAVMHENVKRKFATEVDFDAEASRIQAWMMRLKEAV